MAKPKLSKSHQIEVDYYYQHENADRPFLDYYREELEERLPRCLEDRAPHDAHLSGEQQLATAASSVLDGNTPFMRAIAKRLAEDSPGEMARSASLYARLDTWHGVLDEYDEFFNLT